MTNINIHTLNESVGLQLFDRYYAFRQSLNGSNYISDVEINFKLPAPDCLNIAFLSMPTVATASTFNVDDYDFVFVDNAAEHLAVCTPGIVELLTRSNVYFISGAFLEDSHPLSSKNIPFNISMSMFHDCVTRGFYPQYFWRADQKIQPTKNMIYINGANNSWRQYFIDVLKSSTTAVDIKTSMGNSVIETAECMFEDVYDREFREMLDTCYSRGIIMDYDYYDRSIKVGIDQRFGAVPPGQFLLDEYYQYRCVVFPESGWINNQHFATEKIYKCFVAGTIPFPVSGARTHQMYNAHGYQTAWNLLPYELQDFDNELEHSVRYKKIVQAIEWLENSNALMSDHAQKIKEQNQNNFYKNTIDSISVKKLDSILKTHKKFNA
jgi:hypothetical protein